MEPIALPSAVFRAKERGLPNSLVPFGVSQSPSTPSQGTRRFADGLGRTGFVSFEAAYAEFLFGTIHRLHRSTARDQADAFNLDVGVRRADNGVAHRAAPVIGRTTGRDIPEQLG